MQIFLANPQGSPMSALNKLLKYYSLKHHLSNQPLMLEYLEHMKAL